VEEYNNVLSTSFNLGNYINGNVENCTTAYRIVFSFRKYHSEDYQQYFGVLKNNKKLISVQMLSKDVLMKNKIRELKDNFFIFSNKKYYFEKNFQDKTKHKFFIISKEAFLDENVSEVDAYSCDYFSLWMMQ
jgi:hypothetical protein